MPNNRVYVSSYSMISSLGCNSAETLAALETMQQRFVKDAVNDFPYPHFAQNRFVGSDDNVKASQMCLCLLDNIYSDFKDLKDIPLFLASSTGGIRETELHYAHLDGYPLFDKHFYNTVSRDIKDRYPNIDTAMTFSTACSSSGHGMFHAFNLIKAGVIDKAIVIGYDVLCWTTNVGFDSLKLVSHTGTKPMSKQRDGISLGDGAGIILLEAAPSKEPVAEILGVASNSDGYHISSPNPDGSAQTECIMSAINMSGIDKSQIGYICAHGTGTVMNDEIELNTVKALFGGTNIKMTSLKSFIGHTMGASAVLELGMSILMLKNGKIYQPLNFTDSMDEAVIPPHTIDTDTKYFLKNAFGFGGNNVSILCKII
ncbi:MAG: hypothetical protein IKN25_05595 [Spirochaetales bacterium]|nr:hypothetical protein [Spirochaetales bacterium]